ncbi:MAG: hypothetical protein ACP5I4_09230 [Oceanipulchritudo sp.]
MKKVTILTRAAAREPALEALRQLGVLHILPARPPAGPAIESLHEQLETLEMASRLIPGAVPRAAPAEGASGLMQAGLQAAQQMIGQQEILEQIEDELDDLRHRRHKIRLLGRFEPHALGELREAGIYVRLHVCKDRDLQRLSLGRNAWIVGRQGHSIFLALISRDADARLPCKELDLPGESRAEIDQQITALKKQRLNVRVRFEKLLSRAGAIGAALFEVRNRLEFERARLAMDQVQVLACLKGFAPVTRLDELVACAEQHGWALRIEEPAEDDPVPTLLRSARWASLFQPVMRFLGITPGYREFDTNGLFLIFFTLFFAMIVGDAGYGLLMLGTTLAASRLWDKLTPSAARLFYLLAGATIAWGALTGTWFGIRQLAEWPPLAALVIPQLAAFGDSEQTLIRICLILGTVHLTVAHVWMALRHASLRSLAEAGWALVVWGFYFLAVGFLLDRPHLRAVMALLGTGLLLILFFGEQDGRGLFRGIRRGLIRMPITLFDGISSFSDTVSYIRLFAVGVATKEVAEAFNKMAATVGLDSFIAVLGFSLIVLFGHGLNLLLAALGVLVHGARLNLLEFSRHLGVSWSGTPYRPFELMRETTSL